MTNVSKSRKKKLMCSDLVAAVFFIIMGKGYIPLWRIFLRILYLFNSTSSDITYIISMKEFISLTMVATKTEKMQFLGYHSNGCYEQKQQKNSNYHFKNWVD